MRLALLKGNRFNPWHLQAFDRLPDTEVTAFRAESEIQGYFAQRGGDALAFQMQRIFFDTQAGPLPVRIKNRLLQRFRNREPRILPFHERLRDFDLIQSWELFTDWSAEAVRACEQWDIPLSVMVWDNIPFNMERNPLRLAVKQRVAARARRFIVHTERSRRMLRLEGIDEKRIVKIDPGVDTKLFAPGPSERARFGLAPDDFVLLFVGWLLPRKGIDFLLLALREILSDPALKKHRVRLLAVGSGPGSQRVARLVERLGLGEACVFAGSIPYPEMPEVFRAADVFVLPSIATPEWQEQFGMALIEAMACGLPVVTTLSGAIPEIAGNSAVLCQPNDFVALYDALKGLLASPEERRARAEQGRAQALKRYTLEAYTQQLAALYQDMRSA